MLQACTRIRFARAHSHCVRAFHATRTRSNAKVEDAAQVPPTTPASPADASVEHTVSSCPEGTVLVGLNYLKGQPPVLALEDKDYPAWLWTITTPKPIPDDGPGGEGERKRMRIENRKRIKDQNFMSKQ